jgi:hypothetical protein
MTRQEQWNLFIWSVSIATAALFIFFAVFAGTGCAPAQEVAEYSQAGFTCQMKQAEAIFASSTCNEAQLRVDVVLATDPTCRALDAGPYDVCAKYRERLAKDGGTDGAH